MKKGTKTSILNIVLSKSKPREIFYTPRPANEISSQAQHMGMKVSTMRMIATSQDTLTCERITRVTIIKSAENESK